MTLSVPFSPELALWAKTLRGTEGAEQSGRVAMHPLICHLLDVAAVTATLWDRVLSPAARREIAAGLGLDETTARRWVIFLAGAHDIGKASPVFQYCTKQEAIGERLKQAGFMPLAHYNGTKHGTISTLILSELLPGVYQWDETDAQTMAVAIGGHHGVFPQSGQWDRPEAKADRGKGAAWQAAQTALLDTLARCLGGSPTVVPAGVTIPVAMTVAGLVSVADWIGSDDQNNFPYTDLTAFADAEAYWQTAQERAYGAIDRLLWCIPAGDSAPRDFLAAFPKITEPNPTQDAAISHAARLATAGAPGLTIIEAPMGEGKTEAALYLAEQMGHALGTPGFYIALPTQATSNQMFGRVVDYLHGRFPDAGDHERVNVQLLHGHADLSALFTLLKKAAAGANIPPEIVLERIEQDNEQANGSVVAAEWFTHRKRGLLAPFGVGTVDQALLAVLQTKHVFVRLFGLAHKCIIIDEVHAYDTYMTTLLARLLTWLGALGCPVLLLSATLPNSRREDLLRAYAQGAQHDLPAILPTATYPRLSWVVGGKADAAVINGVSARSTKRVRIEWIDGTVPISAGDANDAFALGVLLKARLQKGGCAAVICNTVARAQAVYTALKPFFPDLASDGAPTLDLLHSRYRFMERDAREKRALLRFGKPDDTVDMGEDEHGKTDKRTVKRPHRAILVATQIIEQSLDLDFDLMVTDIAPADLVLQRLGRLHRHDRGDDRPVDLRNCTLYVCQPIAVSAAGVPTFEQHFDSVYDAHVLLRSWLTLRDYIHIDAVLRVPEDVEAIIEAVYDERPCPVDTSTELQERWETTRQEQQREQKVYRQTARGRAILPPDEPDYFEQDTMDLRDDAPELNLKLQGLTRLSDVNVSTVLLYPDETARWMGHTPRKEEAYELVRRSAPITNIAVARLLIAAPGPPQWEKSSLLRNLRYLPLDHDGSYTDPSSKFTLNYKPDETGVLLNIERSGGRGKF